MQKAGRKRTALGVRAFFASTSGKTWSITQTGRCISRSDRLDWLNAQGRVDRLRLPRAPGASGKDLSCWSCDSAQGAACSVRGTLNTHVLWSFSVFTRCLSSHLASQAVMSACLTNICNENILIFRGEAGQTKTNAVASSPHSLTSFVHIHVTQRLTSVGTTVLFSGDSTYFSVSRHKNV